MRKAVIIVAGGVGNRMGSLTPKQFLEIAGKPILIHTIEIFHNYFPGMEIVLVLPEGQHSEWESLAARYKLNIPYKVARGGAERFFSVKNGLELLGDDIEVIGIHDGVRPLVKPETIEKCFEKAYENGAAIPVVKINDSIRKIEETTSRALNRDDYCLVQTPQCFTRDIILKAYEQDFQKAFTDDASVVEAAGFQVYLSQGNPENIKITSPSDLVVAEAFLMKK